MQSVHYPNSGCEIFAIGLPAAAQASPPRFSLNAQIAHFD